MPSKAAGAGDPKCNLLDSGSVQEKQDLDGVCAKGPVTIQLSTTHDYPIIDSSNSPAVIGTVCLLHPIRVPPLNAKLAMANLERKDQHFLLMPVKSILVDKSILVEY